MKHTTNPEDLAYEIAEAMLLAQGTICCDFTDKSIKVERVTPDSRPLDKLKKDPVTAEMIGFVLSSMPGRKP